METSPSPARHSSRPPGGEKNQEETVTISKAEFEKLKKEAAEYLDGWKRAKADYSNFKKETEGRQEEFVKFAAMGLLIELIPIYNHLKTALGELSDAQRKDPWADGITKISQEFKKLLNNAGVEEIAVLGKSFDPVFHEAVGHEPGGEGKPEMVLREVKPGYTLYGKVFIPAQVIVSSGNNQE